MNHRPFSIAFWIAMSAAVPGQVGCAYKAGIAADAGPLGIQTHRPSMPPGYEFRASHGFDTPFTWPDSPHMAQFSSSRFTDAQWQLSKEITRCWAAFAKNFNPEVPGQPAWPRLVADGSLMSLRPGGQSQASPVALFAGLHKCAL
jgi:para-nitrobenzyl esterase